MEMNRTKESVEALRRKVVIGGGASLHDEPVSETDDLAPKSDDRASRTRDAEHDDERRSGVTGQ
jgi:hypothetical protein